MNTFVRHILSILFVVLAIESRAQGQLAIVDVRPGKGVSSNIPINSSPVLISLDSLAGRPSPAKRSNIKMICGSCGDNSTPSVYVYIIRKKAVSIPLESAGLIQAAWVETLVVAKGNQAKKYGYLAETNGAIILTFKKAFEQELLAALPQDFKKLHNL